MTKGSIAKHSALVFGAMALLTLAMLWPFLPGGYDPLAAAISTLAQAVGILGLLLVPIGIAWGMYELRSSSKEKRRGFARASLIVGSLVVLVPVLVAAGSTGFGFAALVLGLSSFVIFEVAARAQCLKRDASASVNPAPLYLVLLPTLGLIIQIALAAPITEWSRDRAMANASELIGHIEDYQTQYGTYPASLLAQHKDYYPGVIGVEKYHYSSQRDAYNLFFEQPKFILDDFSAREWIVYNPRDEHRMYSHTAWFMLLTPEEQARGQGWYASGEVGWQHWKCFIFD